MLRIGDDEYVLNGTIEERPPIIGQMRNGNEVWDGNAWVSWFPQAEVPFLAWDNLTEVVGMAARELHGLSRYGVNTAYVFKTRDKHYTLYSFDFTRPRGYKLIACLAIMTENRVKVYYRIDKPQEVLYL